MINSIPEFKKSLLLFCTALCVFCTRQRSKSVQEDVLTSDPDLIQIGDKASGPNETLLAQLYDISAAVAPAAVRPDPDLYARRLLRQFRSEDLVMARAIGDTEDYRLLLGGASEDFKTVPQEAYDATSLLALQVVAQYVCTALVAPVAWRHPGWTSVLPYPPENVDNNLLFLAQRMLGISQNRIAPEKMTELRFALQSQIIGNVTNENYILPCTMLALDAEALLL